MAGIEKITKEIEQNAEKEAAEIISAAEKEAERTINKAKEECDAILAASSEKTNRKLVEEDKKTQSQCEQAEKLIMLETKQGVIEDILRKAQVKLMLASKEDYFATLLKLLEKQVQPEKGEMIFCEKDLGRLPEDFAAQVNAIATKNGGMIELSKDVRDIEGGFVLKYGNIEINSSFEALFEENKEELVDIVNEILWQ